MRKLTAMPGQLVAMVTVFHAGHKDSTAVGTAVTVTMFIAALPATDALAGYDTLATSAHQAPWN